MAHILVYLERTPFGLHPASALALCVARDIGTHRGASVTALCPGDAGPWDEGIARAAGRFGADVMVFFGPDGLVDIVERLHPVHVLAPWTAEGLGAVGRLKLGPASPRWIDRARPAGAGADTVTGVIAGTLPWHALQTELDPEYLGPVDAMTLPTWVGDTVDAEAPGFAMLGAGQVHAIAPTELPPPVQRSLAQLGAQTMALRDATSPLPAGTLLWFCDGAGPLPEAAQTRSASSRLIVFPGPNAAVDPSWIHADLVMPGQWEHAVARLHEPLWRAALA